jgi:hypothetical protein
MENKCPICGGETISSVAFDNACTNCSYVEDTYENADVLGHWESTYGTDY